MIRDIIVLRTMAATIVINGTAFDAVDGENVGNVLFEKNCTNDFFKKELGSTLDCEFYYFGDEDVYCKFLMLEELPGPSNVEYDVEKYNSIINHRSVGTPIPEHFRLWECNVTGDREDGQLCGSTTVDLDELLLPSTERIVILGKIVRRSDEDDYVSSETLGSVLEHVVFELVNVGLGHCRRVCNFLS
jgi:hypothetical protein